MLFQKFDLSLSQSKMKNLGLKLLRMLLDQSMLPKVKSSVSDFISTQNLVENFGRVTSTKIW